MIKSNGLIVMLLVILCTLVAYQIVIGNGSANVDTAYAAGGVSNQELIVVPFQVNSSEEKLAVFKKDDVLYKGRKLSGQWCMTVYGMRDGRKLKLEASRWIDNDFFLKDFNINERRSSVMHPETLREYREKGEMVPRTDEPEDKEEQESKPEVPEWFTNPPKEPGVAIYAVTVFPLNS